MFSWYKSGAPWIWLTAGAVSVSLVSVLGVLLFIGWKGLSFFWPAPVYEWQVAVSPDVEQRIIGEVYDREAVPISQLIAAGVVLPQGSQTEDASGNIDRLLIKVGNRERVELDFINLLSTSIISSRLPKEILVIERSRNGNFYGFPIAYNNGNSINTNRLGILSQLASGIISANVVRDELQDIQVNQIGKINWQLEQLRLERRKLTMNGEMSKPVANELELKKTQLQRQYGQLEKRLHLLRAKNSQQSLQVKDMNGEVVTLSLANIVDAWTPNQMSGPQKVAHWFKQVNKFVTDDPREANSEGGVFPAIFGTVFMVLLMSIIVTPLGVVAAVYLHEYAKKNALTRLIRIAVINLAGVPSIVYGVFGLGFFVYMVGGSIDELFFSQALPSATFGTPGILWSSITLAILTLPVVIVSTEEGLSRIPNSVRHGSLALGATQAETLLKIVIPMASPAIMTGLILAVARAAGEVAPLMLVGVVKLAPTLPVDGNFPYVHLERKFMHLGFHIYDVGFQSPNIEAARPLVYATSFLLVTVIIGLNLTAIGIRNYLREKYRSLEQ
ncbi:MAG: phosphate ABC transporter permease PstA [Aliivibrio sp.]|uniref:phosphate ABC transporter permease PstA n=1 Tax=Aliivibrio sp. TaxID=1872443 RepID=UPI001A536138|nr:phosphate ABC transporter permease PstA [Aliivibrio sp.]